MRGEVIGVSTVEFNFPHYEAILCFQLSIVLLILCW